LELINYQLTNDIRNWRSVRNKPIIVTEYGADTLPGYHQNPSFIWTEEYQTDLMIENFKAFDTVRIEDGYLAGELIWNFADFMTKQDYTRAVGNHKGIFTRQRQPKSSAHLMRKRYLDLAQNENEGTLFSDMKP